MTDKETIVARAEKWGVPVSLAWALVGDQYDSLGMDKQADECYDNSEIAYLEEHAPANK